MLFSDYLKIVLKKYGIKNIDLAALLQVSAAQISHYTSGANQFSVKQFEQVGELLERVGAEDRELDKYVRLFIKEKTGIDTDKPLIINKAEPFNTCLSAFENQLIKKFRRLSPCEQNDIFEQVDNLERAARK